MVHTVPVLADILSYQNENVISRFLDMFEVSEQEAQNIFQETKKFIYLTSFDKRAFICDDMIILDEMWHNFVLFTPDYAQFCHTYFGEFRHHVPATKKEKEAYQHNLQQHPETLQANMIERIEWLMGLIYDHLGEETLMTWFSTYANHYTRAYIKTIRK